MTKFIDKTGIKNISVQGYIIEIIKYQNKNKCTVLLKGHKDLIFENVRYNAFKKGQVMNPYHASLHGFGYIGCGAYTSKNSSYQIFTDILKRCYSESRQKSQPSYKDCSVDERWHNFQNFAKWYEDNWKPHMEGWALDKDILFKGNRIYSENTCCFVPREVNNLFIKSNKSRGNLPIGVSIDWKRYKAQINIDGAKVYIGMFDTPEEAFQAYKTVKEKHIKEVADKWRGQITEQVYEAMYNYKVEITD